MAARTTRLREFPGDRPLVSLALAILVVEVVGASGAIFTAQGLTEWYGTLEQPALAPPNWVFGPVWTTLFALVGAALWLVWRQATRSPRKVGVAIAVFVSDPPLKRWACRWTLVLPDRKSVV